MVEILVFSKNELESSLCLKVRLTRLASSSYVSDNRTFVGIDVPKLGGLQRFELFVHVRVTKTLVQTFELRVD